MRHTLIEYRSKAGVRHSQWCPQDAEIPELVEVEGVTYDRVHPVLERSRRSRGLQVIQDDAPVISHSSPRWHGQGTREGRFYKNYTKDGKPVISSRAAYRDAQIRAADHGESILRAREAYADE